MVTGGHVSPCKSDLVIFVYHLDSHSHDTHHNYTVSSSPVSNMTRANTVVNPKKVINTWFENTFIQRFMVWTANAKVYNPPGKLYWTVPWHHESSQVGSTPSCVMSNGVPCWLIPKIMKTMSYGRCLTWKQRPPTSWNLPPETATTSKGEAPQVAQRPCAGITSTSIPPLDSKLAPAWIRIIEASSVIVNLPNTQAPTTSRRTTETFISKHGNSIIIRSTTGQLEIDATQIIRRLRNKKGDLIRLNRQGQFINTYDKLNDDVSKLNSQCRELCSPAPCFMTKGILRIYFLMVAGLGHGDAERGLWRVQNIRIYN